MYAIDRLKRLQKILVIKNYEKQIKENDLMHVNGKMALRKDFIEGLAVNLLKTQETDPLNKGFYMDCLNYKKREYLKDLKNLKEEWKKYYGLYKEKYREEKKIRILIKNLNSTIIKGKEKKLDLIVDEYVNYKVYKELGIDSE